MVSLIALRKRYKAIFGDITDIDLIITDTLKIDKSRLFLDMDVDALAAEKIDQKVSRLKQGEPVSYIIGHREFMSLEFSVTPSVLIPRADTEILVEEIIEYYKGKSPFIFEIGTGSGCIAISLAYYIKDAKIAACDISEGALEVALENAKSNGTSGKIHFFRHDIMEGFPKFDIMPDCIVSNPPYIKRDVIETLDKSVRDFEPLSALDGGEDGLDFYRMIVSRNNLKPGGLFALEIGYNQGEAVKNLMQSDFSQIKIKKDIGGNDRVITGLKK